MNRLSHAERVLGHDVSASMPGRWYAEEVVEAIVAARLASVKALADRLHRRAVLYAGDPEDDLATGMAGAYTLAEQLLRAVLGSDAHTEQP